MNKSVNTIYFSWTDYTVFAMTLFISAAIGVYFGFIRKKQNTSTEYLHGGKKMKVLPIAASLVAGEISGLALIGIPVEIYINGFVFILRVFSLSFSMMVNLYIFVPVFHKLQVTSNFQYLQMRYSTKISMVASLIYVFNMSLIVSVRIYSSILAFSQVCGLSVEVITVTVCGVCIFYTVVGGIKAVVWTDTLQTVIMFVSIIIILILGFVKGDNLENIWKTASEGGRLNFNETSGHTLLGITAEVYTYGIAYAIGIIPSIVANFVIYYIFLPVFFKLQVTSSFEYLKHRYSKRVCLLGSFIYTIQMILIMPLSILACSLAFSEVSGINVDIITVVIYVVCIFYTTVGGFKAVVWTDTFQTIIIVGSLVVVFILGVIKEEGFANIWKKSVEGERINFNLDFDPTNRTAFSTILIGMSVLWSSFGCNPVLIQRFISLPTMDHCKKALWIFTAAVIFFKVFASLIGLVIYSTYSNCDPLKAGLIQKMDQVLPYFATKVGAAIPGVPGIFISGLFCAALSTLSSGFNTIAATIYEDFIKERIPRNTSDKATNNIIKAIVVVVGCVCMGLVFVVQQLGTLLQVAYTIRGAISGPVFAMFIMGMLSPVTNEKGILCGTITGIATMTWILTGAQYYKSKGLLQDKILPQYTDQCAFNISTNATYSHRIHETSYNILYIYRISFYYYCTIGFLVTAILAFIVSWITGGRQQNINEFLFSPIIYPLIKKQHSNNLNSKELEKLNPALQNTA